MVDNLDTVTNTSYIELLLRFLKIIWSWPSLILVVVLYFSSEIKSSLPELFTRLRKAPGGFEFDELQEEVANLRNKAEIAEDQQKQDIISKVNPEDIKLTHTSERKKDLWRMVVSLKAPENFFDQVDEVIFERTKRFPSQFKVVKSPPFQDIFRCRGSFTIKAEIYLKNGKVLKRQHFLSISSGNS